MTASIALDSVSVTLDGSPVLRDVTATLRSRTTAIVGANGSGKSTLARVIAGLVPVTEGSVDVLGVNPARSPRELRALVGMVFSNPDAQIVMPTVREDVAFSLRSQRLARSEVDARTQAALDEFGLAALADRSSLELSGGQKQLLALAGVFVREPRLIVADEPTAYLDAHNARLIANHLLGFTGHVVLVTHDLPLAARCDEAVLVDEGRVVAIGPAAAVITRYEESLA